MARPLRVRRCVAAATALSDTDTALFDASYERNVSAGMEPMDAATAAARDLIALVRSDMSEVVDAVKKKYPELGEGLMPPPEDETTGKKVKPRQETEEPADEVADLIERNDAEGLAQQLYKDLRPITPEDYPDISPEDSLIRLPVKVDDDRALTAVLKKLKFRITDRLQEAADAERITISALYKPEKKSIGDSGADLGAPKDRLPPKPPRAATEKAMDVYLDSLHPKLILDKDANEKQTFGAMMFKEAIIAQVIYPLEFIVKRVKSADKRGEFYRLQSDKKVLVEAFKQAPYQKLITDLGKEYTDTLAELATVLDSGERVENVAAEFGLKYADAQDTAKPSEAGMQLARVWTGQMQGRSAPDFFADWKEIAKFVGRWAETYGIDQDSTDQTYRFIKKDPDVPPKLERIVRVGMKDWREGRDIENEDVFTQTFAFRGTQFGNWVGQVERQAHLNLAYDSLMDLGELTGFGPKIAGIKGELGLAIGAFGQVNTKAAAHFDGNGNHINLTKTAGHGVLGHEWGHALDHNLKFIAHAHADAANPNNYRAGQDARKATVAYIDGVKNALETRIMPEQWDDLLRSLLRSSSEAPIGQRNKPPKQMFFDLVTQPYVYYETKNQLYRRVQETTRFQIEAAKMDDGAPKKYWSTAVEMFARGWETFLFDKAKGGSPYLVGPSRADGALTPKNGYGGVPYPRGHEREYVSTIFQRFLDNIDKETMLVKPVEMTYTIEEIPGYGWAVLDQFGIDPTNKSGHVRAHDSESALKKALSDEVTGDKRLPSVNDPEIGDINRQLLTFAKNIDKIMDEMGLFRPPELKNGSLSESFFFHLRQGWWPESEEMLLAYVAEAHGVKPADIDLLMLEHGRDDFQAALARYAAQRIEDFKAEGNDPRTIFDRLIDMHKRAPALNPAILNSALASNYSTPMPIAYALGQMAHLENKTKVLDPAAGNGMLVIHANPKNVIVIEQDPRRAKNLTLMEYGRAIAGDAMAKLDSDVKVQEVEAVLVNPPSATMTDPINVESYNGAQVPLTKLQHAMVAKAMRAMANRGRAVIVLPANIKSGVFVRAERTFLNWLYSNYNVVSHFEIAPELYSPGGAFGAVRVITVAGKYASLRQFDPAIAIRRVSDMDALWEVSNEGRIASEKVLVGADPQVGQAGGPDQRPGGVQGGGQGKGAGAGAQGAGGTGDAGGQTGGAGGAGGQGGTGGGSGPQTAGNGGLLRNGEGGRPGDGGTGQPGAGTGSGAGAGGTGTGGLGGLTDEDIKRLFDEAEAQSTHPKGGGAPRQPRTGAGGGGARTGPRGPRGARTSAPQAPAPTPTSTPAAPLNKNDALIKALNDLANAHNATTTRGARRAVDQASTPPDGTPPPPLQASRLLRSMRAIEEGPSEPGPDVPMFARRANPDGTHDNQYAMYLPMLRQLWQNFTEEIADFADRIRAFASRLLTGLSRAVRPYGMRFIMERRDEEKYRPSGRKPVLPSLAETATQTVYEGRSQGNSDGIFSPRELAAASEKALDNVEELYGDIDQFVQTELGYATVAEMLDKRLGGYQVDAIAMAIASLRAGDGFIIGDDTGVGKGRTAAAMIHWATRQGKVPVFLTMKSGLYTDMMRDLNDIGFGDTKIMVTNNDVEVRDANDQVIVSGSEERQRRQDVAHVAANGTLPGGAQALFTTYDQLKGKGSENRIAALTKLVADGKAVLVMDESHNAAGGDSSINQLFQTLLTGQGLAGAPADWKPPPTVYLSATFAKRPTNMPLYVLTNLRYATGDMESLKAMFIKGGNVVQQIASKYLTESGSMIRRERSYEGVQREYFVDEANSAIDQRNADDITERLRGIRFADRTFDDWFSGNVNILFTMIPQTWLDANGLRTAADVLANVKMRHNDFLSIVNVYVAQMLLATKVKAGVEHTVAAMNRQEKVVLAMQNTMEAALEDFAQQSGFKVGDKMPGFGWQAIMQRALNSTRRVTFSLKSNPKNRVDVVIPLASTSKAVQDEFNIAQGLVDSLKSELSASPMDSIRHELGQYWVRTDADGKVNVSKTAPGENEQNVRRLRISEITGRDHVVDFSTGTQAPLFAKRNDPGSVEAIKLYQRGEIDVLLINSSGSTGVSLHASEKAFDQRKRHMIVLQPNPDIAVFKQTLGRIHRTGQVEWPRFTVFATGIAAERRQMAVLKKKMATLSSNTSGAAEVDDAGVDFINEYGDKVTAQLLEERPQVRLFMGFADNRNLEQMEDLALTASGRAALFPSDEQSEYFDTIESRFNDLIAAADATGTNKLRRIGYDLQAENTWAKPLETGIEETNPFLSTAMLGKFQVNKLGDVPTEQKIRDAIAQSLNGRSATQLANDVDAQLKVAFDEAVNQMQLEIDNWKNVVNDTSMTERIREDAKQKRKKLEDNLKGFAGRRQTTIRSLSTHFKIGAGFNLRYGTTEGSAVVTGMRYDKPAAKSGNPFAPSNFKMTVVFALPGAPLHLSLSQLENAYSNRGPDAFMSVSSLSPDPDLADWFSPRYVSAGREERYIAYGNILRAWDIVENKGEILRFTMQGQTEMVDGIRMPKDWVPNTQDQPMRFYTEQGLVDYVFALVRNNLHANQMEDEDAQHEALQVVKQRLAFTSNNTNYTQTIVESRRGDFFIALSQGSSSPYVLINKDIGKATFTKIIKAIRAIAPALRISEGSSNATFSMPPDVAQRKAILETLFRQFDPHAPATMAPAARDIERSHMEKRRQSSQMRPAFARASQTGRGLTQGIVAAEAKRIAANWARAPKIVVVRDPWDSRVPNEVRVEENVQVAAGAAPSQGVFHQGTVYLFASRMNGRRDIVATMLHESLGHYGLRGVFGQELGRILDHIANIRRAEVNAKIASYGLDPEIAQHRRIAAEEVLAELAQTRPGNGFVQRAMAAIRQFLRSIGVRLVYSDADIISDFIEPARRYVEDGWAAATGEAGAAPAFSRNEQIARAMNAGMGAVANLRAGGLQKMVTGIRNYWTQARPKTIQALGRRQIVEQHRDVLPALDDYDKEVERYDADKNATAATADARVREWGKLPSRVADFMADLMHDSTRWGVDADYGDGTEHPPVEDNQIEAEVEDLYDRWDQLRRMNPQAAAIYRGARDDYRRHWVAVKQAMAQRIERTTISGSAKSRMLARLEDEFARSLSGVYFPLQRFGDYVITVKGAEDRVVAVSFAESPGEAAEVRAKLAGDFPGFTVSPVMFRKAYNAANDSVSRDFVADLFGLIENSTDPQEAELLKDAINQLYLTSLPDASWAKHGIHRKGTPGYSTDARRAYANNMFHGGYFLSRLKHADQMSKYLRDLQDWVEENREDPAYDGVRAQQVVNEMVERHDKTMNPEYAAWSNRLTAAGFVWFLGMNPASAIANLSQTALVAYPMMGARYGYNRAMLALSRSSKLTAEGRNDLLSKLTNDDERRAMQQAISDGIIDVTQAHDLAGVAEGRQSNASEGYLKVMRAAGFMFHHAEKFNRQVTFHSTYRMERAAGRNHDQAFNAARDMVYRSHFDYSQSNRPRVMMGPVAKTILLFKQFGQNMAYTLGHNAIEAFKGDREAQKTLAGLLVAHALAAGTLGLPLATTLLGLASLIGSDDDEPWDAEVAYRNFLASGLGRDWGEIVAKGVFRGIIPGDLSSRVGLDSLFWRDIKTSMDPNKMYQELVGTLVGPVGGMALEAMTGAADILKGDYLRGLSGMLPNFLGNPVQAYKWAAPKEWGGDAGVVDRSGIEMLKEIDMPEALFKAAGFTPNRLAEAYAGKRAVQSLETRLNARRSALMREFSEAVRNNDAEARLETIAQIRQFNETNPMASISAQQLSASVKARAARIAQAQNGIYLPARRRSLMDEGAFANTGER